MVKRAVLFINGDLARSPRLRLQSGDFLIGVDGGARLAKRWGYKIDLLIGDFDSYKKPPTQVILKTSQDLTDTEFAINYCRQKKFKEIVLVGIAGRRLDHLLANIFLASKFSLTIYEDNQILYLVTSSRVIKGKPGDLISLIPLTDCLAVTIAGVKWTLQGESLKFGSSRGISNVMTRKKALVSLKKGRLLVVYNWL